MPIILISISQIPPITEQVAIRFDGRVNLLIGPNATGKSTILRSIHYIHSRNNGTSIDHVPPPYPEFSVSILDYDAPEPQCELIPTSDWFDDVVEPNWTAVPLLYIPAVRVGTPPDFPVTVPKNGLPGIENGPEDVFDTGRGIFYGHQVDWAIELLPLDLSRAGKVQLARAVQIGWDCSKAICKEVIVGNSPVPLIETYGQGNDSEERSVHHGVGILTTDNELGEPLYAGVLSSGTQGTLLWIYALALKIALHYHWQPGWEKKPAILLIDEIENHLHPTWQRRVIPALLELFPGLQIFATTHSPFVVAGLKAGQVHLLRRDEQGVVTATTNEQDIIGWTMDEILRTMMGVTDPTDDKTAAAAKELRELRNELPRADEKDEERRQERIRELRQLVDRDLLAGGPAAAQREIFEENLAEILERYRQSQSLNQENG